MFRIMIVEDDAHTRRLMEAVLHRAGYETVSASSGEDGFEKLDHYQVDLILLDVMMPGMDGFAFSRELRGAGDMTPILMVTARSLPEDKKQGFLAGTDDYMVKPVDEEEMLLRIKALLRRAKISDERKLKIGEVTLDYDALSVSRKDETVTLPPKEFYLLYKLLSYPDKIFTRIQLMDEIWGMDTDSGTATVNVHINRLRKRFEEWPEFSLEAIRGIGYKSVIHHP
ncbi:MAG: response regulator transcription factor [Lachnospiraceae bacterium]|nr:response regulator transcription factor [Lachnospiraceae bacterium]